MKTIHWNLRRLADVKLRNVFFAFTMSLGMLILLSMYILTDGLQREVGVRTLDFKKLFRIPGRKIVLLVTERRSGSSFLGKIFNNADSFYLFEPLLPYTTGCGAFREERVRTLTDMLRCDFDNIPKAFEEAFKVTHYPDGNARCMAHTLCFLSDDKRFLAKYWRLCSSLRKRTIDFHSPFFDKESDSCGFPLKTNILSTLCKTSHMVAYKVVRLCSLESLEPLYAELTREGHDVYIIHLVRDPRGVMASRLDLGLDGLNRSNAEEEIDELCQRSRANLEYINRKEASVTLGDGKFNAGESFVSDGRYLRVRFEDFALNSLQSARDMYSFIDDDIPLETENLIKASQYRFGSVMQLAKQKDDKSMQSKAKYILAKMGQPFSTTRDPWEVLNKWRYRLPYKFVDMTQKKCGGVFERMGYRIVNSERELLNFSLPVYIWN